MDEYVPDDFTTTDELLRQNVWPVFEQFLWLLVLVIAAASALVLLSCCAGLIGQWRTLSAPRHQTTVRSPRATKLAHFSPNTRRTTMKQVVMLILTLFVLGCVAQAQDCPTTNGTVCRITEFRFKPNTTPGKNNAT